MMGDKGILLAHTKKYALSGDPLVRGLMLATIQGIARDMSSCDTMGLIDIVDYPIREGFSAVDPVIILSSFDYRILHTKRQIKDAINFWEVYKLLTDSNEPKYQLMRLNMKVARNE